MAKRIKAGTVWVNTYRAVSFLMPFGGYKASGLGRENGAEAIDGYLQSKSVWINNGPGGGNPFVMKTSSSGWRLGSCRHPGTRVQRISGTQNYEYALGPGSELRSGRDDSSQQEPA